MASPDSQNTTFSHISTESWKENKKKKTYRSISTLEALKSGTHGIPNIFTDALQNGLRFLDDGIPELLVLGASNQTNANWLSVV